MLESYPSSPISDGMVCRVTDDADAHHPRDSYQQNPVSAEASEPGINHHDVIHHGRRGMATIFSCGLIARLHAIALAILANSNSDAAGVHESHSNRESLVAEAKVDLNEAS